MILDELKSTNSRNEKEEILGLYMADRHNFRRCNHLMLTFDPFVTFGITPGDIALSQTTPYEDLENPEEAFENVANLLSSRAITGNAARDLVRNFFDKCDDEDYKFYYRILNKNLDCGVNVTTWNKVAKKVDPRFVVKIFECQLAADGTKSEKYLYAGTKFIEGKLDGVRVLTMVHPDYRVTMHSRNGKLLKNFTKIQAHIQEIVNQYSENDFNGVVFDGEVMSSSFNDLMKQVHRKENVQADDSVLHLFDIIPLPEFQSGESTDDLRTRKKYLEFWESEFNKGLIRVVGYEEVNMETELDNFNKINRRAIAEGLEGIMVKDPNAKYTLKRTRDWLKVKPVIEATLQVVGYEEGTGKCEGMLGALLCEGEDFGYKIKARVGSGFSDRQREEFWKSRDSIVGHSIEVRADIVSKNQNGGHSLRFPRFKTFRGFESGEKL